MSAIVFRLVLLASGLGLGQLGLDSFVRGAGIAALVQLALATALLVAGSAGFVVPLLDANAGQEVSRLMRNRLLRVTAAAVGLGLALALPVLAHSGGDAEGLSTEPTQVTAGGTVVLAATGLEPNSQRQINLVGPDVVVPYPAVTTDAAGMFSVELTIPAHLPAGTYTFQAIGDETMTTEVTVMAAAGSVVAEPPNEAAAKVAPRSRSGTELGIIGALVVLMIGFGLLLVARAERLGRTTET